MITRMAVSDDGEIIAAGFKDGSVVYLTMPVGEIHILPAREKTIVTAIGLNSSGNLIAVGYSDGVLRVTDRTDGTILVELKSHKKSLNDLEFMQDDIHLITLGGDGRLIVLKGTTGVNNPLPGQRYEL